MDLTNLTIETKCWERDWRWVLSPERMKVLFGRCQAVGARRMVWINNGESLDDMRRAAENLVSEGLIDAYGVVAEHAQETLSALHIDAESFQGGYFYSIAELVGLYTCPTKYLLHFAGDTLPDAGLPSNWVEELMVTLETHPNWAVTNLTWNGKYAEAKRDADELVGDDSEWAVGYGFSDQMYLVRAAEFKQPIYDEAHPAGARYPSYGGNLFEKRVDAYMRNHHRLRGTWLGGAYTHKNFKRKLNLAAVKAFLMRSKKRG